MSNSVSDIFSIGTLVVHGELCLVHTHDVSAAAHHERERKESMKGNNGHSQQLKSI